MRGGGYFWKKQTILDVSPGIQNDAAAFSIEDGVPWRRGFVGGVFEIKNTCIPNMY
jgi:hypothetical protein